MHEKHKEMEKRFDAIKNQICECRHDGNTYSNVYCKECGNGECKLCVKNVFKSFLQSEIDLAVAEERKRIVDIIEKSFDMLDKSEQMYPMAILCWSKEDRTNWILSFTKNSIEGGKK